MADVQVKVPGKVYVAGEYAVVEADYSAIITAVDSFVHLELSQNDQDGGHIYSQGFTEEPVNWERVDGNIQLAHSTEALKYVLSALQVTEEYVQALNLPAKAFNISIKSELDHEDGHKFGLGSSGAVTVAGVQALLLFYEVEPTDLLVYKLSVLAQMKLGVNSSFGDLAASTFTGWIRYTNFERDQVRELLEDPEKSVQEIVEATWSALDIERLDIADTLNFLIGWTGSPASSDNLVGEVQERKAQTGSQYTDFLQTSQRAVDELTEALPVADEEKIAHSIRINREVLKQMGQQTNVVIETPQLTTLCEIAESYGGAAKTSGAGGGDSGIAFIFEEEKVPIVEKAWQEAGIVRLPLVVYTK